MKPQDLKASQTRFGVELETTIPVTSHVTVGGYHYGTPVTGGQSLNGYGITAPAFNGSRWKAERDGSIAVDASSMACEFVSPVLHGAEGVGALGQFVRWMNDIGAKVNNSCGCHVTIGVDSLIGTDNAEARAQFARKLAHIAQWHARAIYGQTGTGRHLNQYSHTFSEDVAAWVKRMEKTPDLRVKERAAVACGRGMVNFRKLFSSGVVEFRAFAGTTNLEKIQHHIATAIGLCRRAAEVQCLGAFKKNKLQEARTRSARDAVMFLWDYLGWTGRKRPVALGLFGELYENFPAHSAEALRLCRRFDERYPDARL